MQDFDRRVVPNAGLDEIIVEDDVMRQLKEIVQFEKARYVGVRGWGGDMCTWVRVGMCVRG